MSDLTMNGILAMPYTELSKQLKAIEVPFQSYSAFITSCETLAQRLQGISLQTLNEEVVEREFVDTQRNFKNFMTVCSLQHVDVSLESTIRKIQMLALPFILDRVGMNRVAACKLLKYLEFGGLLGLDPRYGHYNAQIPMLGLNQHGEVEPRKAGNSYTLIDTPKPEKEVAEAERDLLLDLPQQLFGLYKVPANVAGFKIDKLGTSKKSTLYALTSKDWNIRFKFSVKPNQGRLESGIQFSFFNENYSRFVPFKAGEMVPFVLQGIVQRYRAQLYKLSERLEEVAKTLRVEAPSHNASCFTVHSKTWFLRRDKWIKIATEKEQGKITLTKFLSQQRSPESRLTLNIFESNYSVEGFRGERTRLVKPTLPLVTVDAAVRAWA